jgi:uncharacterized protein YbjT (DUF2867 family)
VTGATGNVGGEVVSLLAEAGDVRALARDPASAMLPDGIEMVRGDLRDPAVLHAALDGVDRVFLVWPLGSGELAPAVMAVIAEHARRVVYLSSYGVPDDGADAKDPITQFHREVEQAIIGCGLEWTFLRSGGMATNTLGWARQVRAESVVRWPYGAAARSLVHEADLAAVGALALRTDDHAGSKYALTGPATITQVEQAQAIGDAIGRPVRYEELSREQAREQMLGWGWPAATVEGALDAWTSMVDNPEEVTSTVEDVTGRPARSYAQWAIDHADDFR